MKSASFTPCHPISFPYSPLQTLMILSICEHLSSWSIAAFIKFVDNTKEGDWFQSFTASLKYPSQSSVSEFTRPRRNPFLSLGQEISFRSQSSLKKSLIPVKLPKKYMIPAERTPVTANMIRILQKKGIRAQLEIERMFEYVE